MGPEAEEHYFTFGIDEARNPNPLFDSAWYRNTYRLSTDVVPILHYLMIGAALCYAPSPVFAVNWYRQHTSSFDPTVESDLEHYLRQGWSEGSNPHPLFSTAWYVGRTRQSFGRDLTPFEAFMAQSDSGSDSGSPWFCIADHDLRRPDVRRAGLHPFRHWVEIGHTETTFDDWLIDSFWYESHRQENLPITDLLSDVASHSDLDPSILSRDPLRQRIARHLLQRDSAFREHLGLAPNGMHLRIDWESWATRLALRKSEDPLVSIVIPTLNHLEDVVLTLDSISKSTDSTPYEVILVDDGSQSDVSAVFAKIPNLILIRHDQNRGYAEACETGIQSASGTYLMLLNNDVEVVDHWLDPLVAILDAHGDVGAVGSMLIRPDNRLQEAGVIIWADGTGWQYGNGCSPFDPIFRTQRTVDYCSAASLLVRRATWNQVGGFDPQFRPAYYEDSDLCMSITEAGQKVIYEPKSVAFHREGSTHGQSIEGLKRHQFINHEKFRAKWAIELQQREPISPLGPTPEMVLRACDKSDRKVVVVVDHKELTPDSDSGSLRMHRLIEEFVRQGRRVVFHGVQGLRSDSWAATVAELGVEVYGPSAPIQHVLSAHAERIEFVWISRPSVVVAFLPTYLQWAPHLPLVYDMVDAHGLRVARQMKFENDENTARQARQLRGCERAIARLADVVVTLSDADETYIKAIAETDLVTVRIPNVHVGLPTLTPFAQRSGVMFVGSFEHTPNVDAVGYLINEIMPMVWTELGDVPVTIVGSKPPQTILDLATNLVTVTGWVEDLRPIYAAHRLSVAPLRYGAGVKGKVGEALAYGVPVVTTTVGSEGMPCIPGQDIMVEDDPRSLSRAIIDLYTSADVWDSFSSNGLRAIEDAYGHDALTKRIERLFATVQESTNYAERSQTP